MERKETNFEVRLSFGLLLLILGIIGCIASMLYMVISMVNGVNSPGVEGLILWVILVSLLSIVGGFILDRLSDLEDSRPFFRYRHAWGSGMRHDDDEAGEFGEEDDPDVDAFHPRKTRRIGDELEAIRRRAEFCNVWCKKEG